VFNHNMETVPHLYKSVRPGADYNWSLELLKRFKSMYPQIITKSGLMLGLGEKLDEVLAVMQDLRSHDCEMLTLGQYLQPTKQHLSVQRYVLPTEFDELAKAGYKMGFKSVASGPLVRSSYHAEQQLSVK
ncbi:MAG: lipoyl synthase, partial [Candidatus Marithrix sp.]|nr:lipoyl synthase [Candidatus Marithrix sp.]